MAASVLVVERAVHGSSAFCHSLLSVGLPPLMAKSLLVKSVKSAIFFTWPLVLSNTVRWLNEGCL